MTPTTLPQKLMASSLCLLLVSCSTTQPMVAAQSPTGIHDLARYALVIQETPDWLKNHREKILVGTVIVIAGVAFVAAVAASGGGALILVPLVFVVENAPGGPAAPIAEATR